MPEPAHSRVRHQYLQALILIGFALLIAHLNRQGNLSAYVTLRMVPYVKLSAIALFTAAMHQIYSALRSAKGTRVEACDCGIDHSHSPNGSVLLYALFLLPLIIGFLLPESVFGG
jgi:putative membrane protein